MKRILSIFFIAISTYFMAQAVPAHPGKRTYRQPDGTILTLQNHGDEYFNWTTDQNGRIVEKGKDGFYRQVDMAVHETRRAKGLKALNNARRKAWASYEEHRETNFGDRKVLCIIANFTDSTFIVDNPNQAFHDLLNQEGYSYNGAIGSVRDYYIDNSNGQYRPSFDVFGPVTLSQSSAYYDTMGVRLAIKEAYELMADQINVDDYDTDNDGAIDIVLFYYPGRNQAENAGTESIWPHQSTGDFGYLGSKKFTRYFCTSELYNFTGKLCGIGTTCHEFAHSLGIPDLYDTDYEVNGLYDVPSRLDLMSGGNYNDAGRRPPYLNFLELNMLGWMNYPQNLEEGSFTLEPIRNYKAYQTPCATDGEYFAMECRDNYKWDSALGDYGLFVYHIDKSSRLVANGKTAAQMWNTNKINAYAVHPCFIYMTSADNQYSFPGRIPVSSLVFTDWDEYQTGMMLHDIAFDGENISFSASLAEGRKIFGNVYTRNGKPLEGAKVVLTQSAYPFAAPALLHNDVTTTTDGNGYYEILLPETASSDQILTVNKEGYISLSMNLPISAFISRQDFYLPLIGQGIDADLLRYNTSTTSFTRLSLGYPATSAAICYPADEIMEMGAVGSTFQRLNYYAYLSNPEKVYAIIDIGGTRALLKDITDQYAAREWISIDIADEGIVIPENADVYIGLGMTGIQNGEYPFLATKMDSFNHGLYKNVNFLNSSDWRKASFSSGNIYSLCISAKVIFSVEEGLNNYGYAFIKLEQDIPTVIAPDSKTVYATEWYLDGVKVDGPADLTSIPAGKHTYLAHLLYYDGTEEKVFYDFTR